MGTKGSKAKPAKATPPKAPKSPSTAAPASAKSTPNQKQKDMSREARAARVSYYPDHMYTSTFEDLAPGSLEKSNEIWSLEPNQELFFKYSDDTTGQRVDVFISHVWEDHVYLKAKQGGPALTYYFDFKSTGVLKATEQLEARAKLTADTPGLRSLATRDKSEWRFWMDHTCCNQDSKDHKERTVKGFRDTIELSNSLAVMLSPTYFSRLWCLFEVTCFMALKDLAEIAAYTWAFMDGGPELIEQYVDSLRNISIQNAGCLIPEDREILRGQVNEHFHSEAHFESFAKLAGTALVLQSLLLSPAVYSTDRYAFFIAPFLELVSEEFKLPELRQAFEQFAAVDTYEKLKSGKEKNPADVPAYTESVMKHIHAHVTPIVRAAGAKALVAKSRIKKT